MQQEKSKIELLRELPYKKRKKFLDSLQTFEYKHLKYDWYFNGRPKQQYPGPQYPTIVLNSGRGFGKTATAMHWAIEIAKNHIDMTFANPDDHTDIQMAFIGQTSSDVRDVMVYGSSGIMQCSPPNFKPHYTASNRSLIWPNGVRAKTFSGDEIKQFRGPNLQVAFVDEFCKYKYMNDFYDMLVMSVRIGISQIIFTSTPMPEQLWRELVTDPDNYVIEGNTFENRALSKTFITKLRKRYEINYDPKNPKPISELTKEDFTRLGRQEIFAQILEDNPNAIFFMDNINQHRIFSKDLPECEEIIIGLDPSASNTEKSDEAGLIVSGKHNDHGYVIADETMKDTMTNVCLKAIDLYKKYAADYVVVETNNGGDWIEEMILNLDNTVAVLQVKATKGKALRAQPIAGLYEQGKIHHVGNLSQLETEMVDFNPITQKSLGQSPNRLDALVWSFTHLFKINKDNEVYIWS